MRYNKTKRLNGGKKKYSRKNIKKQKKYGKGKNKSKKQRGGCGCSKIHGGSTDTPSFSNVPIHSFYPYNKYDLGTDVQGQQVSTRILPNTVNGGGKTKKMRGGSFSGSTINLLNDPILGNGVNLINSSGNTSGALFGSNILGGISNGNYSATPYTVSTLQNPLV